MLQPERIVGMLVSLPAPTTDKLSVCCKMEFAILQQEGSESSGSLDCNDQQESVCIAARHMGRQCGTLPWGELPLES